MTQSLPRSTDSLEMSSANGSFNSSASAHVSAAVPCHEGQAAFQIIWMLPALSAVPVELLFKLFVLIVSFPTTASASHCDTCWKIVLYITSSEKILQFGVSLTTTTSLLKQKANLLSTASKGHVMSRVTAGIPVAVLFWKRVWWERLRCCQHRRLLPRLDMKPKETRNSISEGQNFRKLFWRFSASKHWRQVLFYLLPLKQGRFRLDILTYLQKFLEI